MPGVGSSPNASAATPNRKTSVTFDLDETEMIRPPWSLTRRGPAIARSATSQTGQTTHDASLLPSGAWTIQSHQEAGRFERTPTQAGIIRKTDFQTTPQIEEFAIWRKLTELPGLTWAADVADVGNYFIQKSVPAGASYDSSLTADAAAFPSPANLPTANIPMDRVASGLVTYPANQPFMIRFQAAGVAAQLGDTVASMLFGGATDAQKRDGSSVADAGHFALNLFSDGKAWLQEKVDGLWKVVHDFRWAQPHDVPGKFHNLLVTPQPAPKKQINVVASHSDAVHPPGSMVAAPSVAPRGGQLATVYTHSQHVTGYANKAAVTGPGTVRLDQRRDQQVPIQVSVLTYPSTALIVDAPFICPFTFADAEKLYLNVVANTPAGTSVIGWIYRADNGAPLVLNADESFQAVGAANGAYFVTLTLHASADGKTAPQFLHYEVFADGVPVSIAGTNLTGGKLRSVSITGPSQDPSHETASLNFEDPADNLTLLRTRGRITCRVNTTYDPADQSKKCCLFYGETAHAAADRWGTSRKEGLSGTGATRNWPSKNARRVDISLVGRWARLADQLSFTLKDFNRPPYAPWSTDRSSGLGNDRWGSPFPWRITDIIEWCLREAGVPAEQIDVPDLPIRAYTSGKDPSEYLLQATASISDYLNLLARQYLGAFLWWDANARGTGATNLGVWRLIQPPTPPYTTLWTLRTWGPATSPTANLGTPKLAHSLASYPAKTGYLTHYSSYVKAPEANFVVVTATGELLPSAQGQNIFLGVKANPASFSIDGTPIDRTHPDYLGRLVPVTLFDSTLGLADPSGDPQASVDFVCRRIYDVAAHAVKVAEGRGPLVLVTDPSDTLLNQGNGIRPFRPYDVIEIATDDTHSQQFFIRSCQVDYKSDQKQMMEIEAWAVQNTFTI